MIEFDMTDEEIRRSWRNASNPLSQVDILAQLNDVPYDAMFNKLCDLGLDPPHRRIYGSFVTRLNEVEALYDAGLNDSEIAAELGCSTESVYQWRRLNGFVSNARAGRPRKQIEKEN